MKIESTDKDIRTLLSSTYYKIPRFQRPYSWEKENIQEFWDDIVRDNPGDYFIGSMVVYNAAKHYFGVVDGQQRLTTITILLAVLRNKLADLGFNDLAEGIHGLIERKNINNKFEYVLSTESSYPYFQDHIQKWGEPELKISPLKEEYNLQVAYDLFKSLVNGIEASANNDTTISESKRLKLIEKKLIKIRDDLLDLKLIFIKLENEDDAYLIFETLNSRGKDLGLTDLVKSHLTRNLKPKSSSIDQTKEKWGVLLKTIEGSSIDLKTDTFIHHFWLSKFDYQTEKKLFKFLKGRVTKPKAQGFLDDLVNDAGIYRGIHETSYGEWSKQESKIEDALNALMLFKVKQQTPCVLSLVREYKSKKIKKKHLEKALIAIEKFHFLFTAITSQRSSGGISQMYAAIGRRLFKAHDTQDAVDVIRDLRYKLYDRIPTFEEVKALLPEIIYTINYTKQRKLVKYMLIKLDRVVKRGVIVDYDKMTIEHLLPQSLIKKGGYEDSTIGQIGNLILVSEELNGKLQNKTFKDKKKILIAEKYELPSEIMDASDWSKTDIIDRTKQLAEEAYNSIWKIS